MNQAGIGFMRQVVVKGLHHDREAKPRGGRRGRVGRIGDGFGHHRYAELPQQRFGFGFVQRRAAVVERLRQQSVCIHVAVPSQLIVHGFRIQVGRLCSKAGDVLSEVG